jgi:prolipoprotein diacylglyceryl transferase
MALTATACSRQPVDGHRSNIANRFGASSQAKASAATIPFAVAASFTTMVMARSDGHPANAAERFEVAFQAELPRLSALIDCTDEAAKMVFERGDQAVATLACIAEACAAGGLPEMWVGMQHAVFADVRETIHEEPRPVPHTATPAHTITGRRRPSRRTHRMMVLAYLPSPSVNVLHLGPLQLRLYGLAIAIGVLIAVGVSQRRWAARGGDPNDIATIALWAVPAGVIGSRAYHVMTDWQTYQADPIEAFAIWRGGLGIPGGIIVGAATGALIAQRKRLPVADLLDVVAPAIAIAQAVGRLGNWANQELFGRPTTLPWGLRIDLPNRPTGLEQFATFHPTFLYEALWNLGLAAVLLAIDRRHRLRSGQLFVLYVTGYATGRLWVESLRIDPASLVAGIRINLWVSALAIAGGTAAFIMRQRHDATALPSHQTSSSPDGLDSDEIKRLERTDDPAKEEGVDRP